MPVWAKYAEKPNIPWHINGKVFPQPILEPDTIKCAIGHSTAEALAALITSNKPHHQDIGSEEKLLALFQSGHIAQLDEWDGHEELHSLLHRQGFTARAGGPLWKLAPKATSDSEASAIDLPPPSSGLSLQLDALNQLQTAINQKQDILKSLQWQLYALWWQHGNYLQNTDEENRDAELLNMLQQFIQTDSEQANLFNILKTLTHHLNASQNTLAELRKAIEHAIKETNEPYFLKTETDQPFYEPYRYP